MEVTCSCRVLHLWYRGKRRRSRKYLLYYLVCKEKQLHCEYSFYYVLIISKGDDPIRNPLTTLFPHPFLWIFLHLTRFYSVFIFIGFILFVSVYVMTCIYYLTCVITVNLCLISNLLGVTHQCYGG